jgi:hypothetical protein
MKEKEYINAMIAFLKTDFRYIVLFTAMGLISFMSCDQRSPEITNIRGIYGNPKPFWDKDLNLKDLGVNAIFVHSGSINHNMIHKARSEGLMVFAEFATLNGKNYVDKHPEAWAINEKGEKVQAASWFMGVCPTEPGFRKYRLDQLRDLLLEYELDGIWMDYVHWHAQFEEPEPILPETCFCNHCRTAFSAYSGITLPEGTISEQAHWILKNHDNLWRDWRCIVILNWAEEMKSLIKEIKPETLLGLYHCPWDDQEFDGARRRILGLDLDILKEPIDVFSPMVYHARMGRKPDWVSEHINWLCNRLDIRKNSYPKVWPIVQVYNDPVIVTSEEFETVLRYGMSGRSSGVMMFTSYAVAEDEGKTAVMKHVYTTLK